MYSLLRFAGFSFFVITLFILAASCNNGNDEKKTDEKSTADTSKKESSDQINQPKEAIISGILDTLWTDSLSFTKLPADKKMVFVFTFRQLDTLTLHGWATKDSVFNTNPDLKLKKGHAGTLNYGDDMYFGNVILRKVAVKKIKNLLDSQHSQFVLFAPQLINGSHIGYKIFLSKQNPSSLIEVLAIIPTGEDANPSPPKNN